MGDNAVENEIINKTKEYLWEIGRLWKLYLDIKAEYKDLMDNDGLKALTFDGIKVKNSKNTEADFVKLVIKRDEKVDELATVLLKYVETKHKIAAQIQTMQNLNYMQLLFKHYVENKDLQEIAKELDLTYDTIIRLHGRALKEFGNEFLNRSYEATADLQ